jgi:lysozyme family protein
MNDHLNHMKLLVANAGSWIATIAGMQATKDFLQVLCLIASLAVSGCSIWWIARQNKVLQDSQKPR